MGLLPIIYVISFLLPLLFYFLYKQKKKEKAVRVVLFYSLYCIIQELTTFAASVAIPALRPAVAYLFASYTIIEFSFFCIFYRLLFPPTHVARKYVLWICVGFIAFSILDFFAINHKEAQFFDSFVSGVEALILILMCGYYLYYQVTHTMSMMVYNTFNFWVIVTFFMFISATFFLYLMTDAMGKDPEFQRYYMMINLGANLLKNFLLAFAFTRMYLPPPTEKKNRRDIVSLGDELILQQNT